MNKKHSIIIIIALIIASFAAFGRIAGNEFINFDDVEYITANYHIRSGLTPSNIKWAFTDAFMGNWHPLALLSHMLDWNLFGARPAGHHIVSLLLHIGAVIFLFLFLRRSTGNLWPAAFASALFALHPLRVESVAWAAERKDVLSMFFGMACLYSYTFYAEKHKYSQYFLCLFLFALSLMSKAMLVTLPFVFLLIDYWPLGRWQATLTSQAEKRFTPWMNIILEKIPFFLLSAVSSVAALWAQNKSRAVVSFSQEPFFDRIANMIISYFSYLGKIFWPFDLAVFYHPADSFPLWQITLACLVLITITIVVIYTVRNMPFLFVGWFWYLGTLIPVIGLVQIGSQAMADRYTYMPSIGISIMVAWIIAALIKKNSIRKIFFISASVIFISIVTVLTWQQCGHWRNSMDLFNHALRVTKDNDVAHNGLAMAFFETGQINDAINHYNEAIRISPFYALAYSNRGVAYASLGEYQQAIDDFNKAISMTQYDADMYGNRGIIYLRLGNREPGCHDLQKACELGKCRMLKIATLKGTCP